MDKLNLKTLYRNATRGLPQHADQRVTVDELLALARGESLGARTESAISGIGSSSDQALALKIATATEDWSRTLAGELAQARRPSLAARLGRLHPVIVHFPIAFFPAALFTAIVGRSRPAFAAPVRFLILAGAIAAPAN